MTTVKNVRRGLEARSAIVEALEKGELSVVEISRRTKLSQHRVRYHLRRLKRDNIVACRGAGRKARWRLTGIGQTSLDESTT
ncbi:MAG: winged helix-turn-helix domain-containing protein [Candidatus Caldarchaeum sp.]|nr:winged helix-turn-helix domain-containing protein [Candidatus Caldarchaeum sp.]MDW8063235.1 winged helix-turn-helix domain-containing protein [Candidatus Caldarchaeum sp.]